MVRTLSVLALSLISGLILPGRAAQAADLPAPLVVVTGGYASCADDGAGGVSPFGGNSTAAGVRMINELTDYYAQPGVAWHGMSDHGIRWLFTCFNETSDLFLQGNDDAGVVAGGAWDLSPLVARIERLSEDYRRPIFVIGHSHGGWLAMRLVEALRQPITTGYLATIDPISFTECNAAVFADALAWPFDFWGTTAPCRQAPGDITAGDLAQIRANLGANHWKHYWQTHFAPLHSGGIPNGPDFSLDMTPFFSLLSGGAAASWNAHIRIAGLDSIWFGLQQSLKSAYNSP